MKHTVSKTYWVVQVWSAVSRTWYTEAHCNNMGEAVETFEWHKRARFDRRYYRIKQVDITMTSHHKTIAVCRLG